MRWREIPRGAKAYILYHTLISPQLIVWYLLPLFMLQTGYSVLDVGAFFTAVNLAFIPLTYLVGRFFNQYPLKYGLVLIDAFEGSAYILYSLAQGALAPIALFLGRLLENLSGLFYPLYQAFEQIIYPEDRYEEIYAWHLRLPEISQFVGFLVLGYLFGYVWNTPRSYRHAFLAFGLYSAVMVIYMLVFLPPVDRTERITPEGWTFPGLKSYSLLLLIEGLYTAAGAMAPNFVLLYYIVVHLKKTLFEVMLIEAGMSVTTVLATYVSERVPKNRGMLAISAGLLLNTLNVGIMSMSPSFPFALLAYAIGRFGSTLAFPFYRAWLFGFIPRERVSEFHAALSGYNRLIGLLAPLLAGGLAYLHPALPYRVSLVLFLVTSGIFAWLAHRTVK